MIRFYTLIFENPLYREILKALQTTAVILSFCSVVIHKHIFLGSFIIYKWIFQTKKHYKVQKSQLLSYTSKFTHAHNFVHDQQITRVKNGGKRKTLIVGHDASKAKNNCKASPKQEILAFLSSNDTVKQLLELKGTTFLVLPYLYI